jgi:hypothetical protein
MNNKIPIVRKLQTDAINQDISVSTLLRTAKVVATKLDLQDALIWIDRELDGYLGLPVEELPAYRRLKGVLKGHNPYHGWKPILFENSEQERVFSQAPLGVSIGTIEEYLKGKHENDFIFEISPETETQLINALEYPLEVKLQLDRGAIFRIVDAVRNLILNWSLELEKAGILGEGMVFSGRDKREATPITQQFFAQNIGVVGNVTDQAQVANEQAATMKVNLDVAAVQDFAAQARQALPSLPEDARNQVEPMIADLEDELAQGAQNQSRLRELLGSVRTVCEGAAGNLSAQGMLGLLGSLL